MFLLTSCRVDLRVHVEVGQDGSGTVSVEAGIDRRVLDEVPDLATILRLDDVRAAGWVVDVDETDAGLDIVAIKPFASIDQLPMLLAEVDGPDGLFTDATLDVGRQGAVTTYELTISMDLDRPVESFIDPAVALVLDGELFGTPVEELERRAGGPLDDTVSLLVTAAVPGGRARYPATGESPLVGPGPVELVVTGELLDPEIEAADQAAVDARKRVDDAVSLTWVVWTAIGVVIVIALAVLIALRQRRRRTPLW